MESALSDTAVEVDGLRKAFGSVLALDGLSFRVPAGSVLGLLGPNGSGKTTTVSILSTALRPDAGRAIIGGLDVVADAARVRAVIGFAGQFAAVDPNLTGRENLTLIGRLSRVGRRPARTRAGELLAVFGLTDAADRLVRGYCGGMRRRLDLAAALVHRPPVLFLDEPTTGLDPSGRSDLWAIIEELLEDGTTVLLTTQYLEEADRLADNIVVVNGGRVIAEGTASQLKASLGSTIIEIRMPEVATAHRALGRLQRIAPTELQDEGRTLAVKVSDSGRSVLEVARALDDEGLTPDSL